MAKAKIRLLQMDGTTRYMLFVNGHDVSAGVKEESIEVKAGSLPIVNVSYCGNLEIDLNEAIINKHKVG